MILNTSELKDISASIKTAVDPNDYAIVTETLELSVENSVLKLSVTNREYYVQVRVNVNTTDTFKVSVNAKTFLNLVSQITTETIEFNVDGNTLVITANGTYKIPIIFDGETMVSIPEITVGNIVNTFTISGETLLSILNYNSKELQKLSSYSKPVQRYYYVDNEGAITYTTGACVNNFTLGGNVAMLLSQKVVKLFKLFNENDTVTFSFGFDEIDGMTQNKASFSTANVTISTLLQSDESMLKSVPVSAIRGRANDTYTYSANINKDNLLQLINRLMVMYDPNMSFYSNFVFSKSNMKVESRDTNNSETLYYNNDIANLDGEISCVLDLKDLKLTLESCSEPYLTINFGDSPAVVVSRGHVKNVIPKVQGV
jgi:hypothetical protein